MKKFLIQTFGCQMNVYDGQRIASLLLKLGLEKTEDLKDADLIIINTCSVREKASEKIFSLLGRIRRAKKTGALFGIVGCVAKAEGAKAFKRVKGLNFVLGPQSYHKLPEILENPDTQYLNIDFSDLEKFDALPENTNSTAIAYIPVQEGCDHVCTYCIVPYTRGREISRDISDVMKDVNSAVKHGAVEICFLGQNVNGYRFGLHNLITKTAKIHKIKRIRYTSSYPTEMTDELIALHGTEKKLLPFVNMPIQSGSPDILKKMNRPYSLAQYMEIVDKFKKVNPEIQISSDFIVGFPGETDNDFKYSLDVAKSVGFINSYSFKYSPRPHTAAAVMKDQVPENIKSERLKILDGQLNENNRAFNQSLIGKTLSCLIDEKGKLPGQVIARTPWMQQVVLDDADKYMGKIVDIEITSGNKSSLRGKVKA